MPSKQVDIENLYYITHIKNIPSILEHGILSHRLVEERSIPYEPIYDASIVNRRKEKQVPSGRSLWDYANLYFQAMNPMLFRVVHEKGAAELAILAVRREVVRQEGAYVSDGNAASLETNIQPAALGLNIVIQNWPTISSEWWHSADGSKRKIMAECLVPDSVSPESIHTIYVSSHPAAERVKRMSLPRRVEVVQDPARFFQPAQHLRITDKLYLADGDMFFSKMHTLTVSVNTKGIMGKGLASRAKHQFPDVYVTYQDACRRKLLGMGKPYLYKREAFVDEELADEPASLPSPNARKWFLLFATKRHWRDHADLEAIRTGLRWVRENYRPEGIKSLALPALGCGLGWLEWRDVGPVMCRELESTDIYVNIYLPQGKTIPEEHLSKEFLLGAAR